MFLLGALTMLCVLTLVIFGFFWVLGGGGWRWDSEYRVGCFYPLTVLVLIVAIQFLW